MTLKEILKKLGFQGNGNLLTQNLADGFYPLSATDSPDGKPYILQVQEVDSLKCQWLWPQYKGDGDGGHVYYRSWSPKLKRYTSFTDLQSGQRLFMVQALTTFAQTVQKLVTPTSCTIGLLTDTHDKLGSDATYYGVNGEMHVKELEILTATGLLDLVGHLGDAIDGIDQRQSSAERLGKIVGDLNQSTVPFFMVKGNHDDNDKFVDFRQKKDEAKNGAFDENTYGNRVYKAMFSQPQVNAVSYESGLSYYDKGKLRLIFMNTSDVPFILDSQKHKVYSTKSVLAVRQAQMEDLAQLLAQSSNRQIVVFSHAPFVDQQGKEGLTYNGAAVHTLLKAFNEGQQGVLEKTNTDSAFSLEVRFDFSKNHRGKVRGNFAGHWHEERNYRVDGIPYLVLNCSALMGLDHDNTSEFNRGFKRRQGELNESAGYVLDINLGHEEMVLLGYGAATSIQVIPFNE